MKQSPSPVDLTPQEAKPCPFCGAQPFYIPPWLRQGDLMKRLVACRNDDCYAQPAVTGPSRKFALGHWNYRGAQ